MLFGLFSKPHRNLIVRELVFTYVMEHPDNLGVAGLAEIMVGKRFLPWDITLSCTKPEITTDEVKTAIQTISCEEYLKNDGAYGSEMGSLCTTSIGTIIIAMPNRETMMEYGAPSHWRRHGETFWYCNKKTTVQDIVRGSEYGNDNIRFCKA